MNTMVQIRTVMKEHNRFPPKGFIVFSYSINTELGPCGSDLLDYLYQGMIF